MVANPEITNVIATQSADTVNCLIAIKNSSTTNGMVQTLINEYSGGTCIGAPYTGLRKCIAPTISPYINELYIMQYGTFTPTIIPSLLCVRTYQCTIAENCPASTCSAYNTLPYWIMNNISISSGLGITPNRISNGISHIYDKSLIFTWIPPTNITVTYHEISLYNNETNLLLQSGFIKYDPATGLIVSGLTNNITYRLDVVTLSDDGKISTTVSILGRPNAACTNLICDFNVS